MLSTLLLAATTGLVSTLHCWGMCGGIVAALSLGAPAALRARPVTLTLLAFAYNLGRISSYALIGALAGAAAGPALAAGGGTAFRLLQFAGLVALVFAALRLGGWLPRNGAIERIGLGLWRRLSPLTRRLLPVDRMSRAVLAGLAWGFLPCGLVYAMLPVGAATGSAVDGALTMLAFGAGTLPGMIAASALAQRLGALAPLGGLRRYAAAMLIALSCAWFGLQWLGGGQGHAHGGHEHGGHPGHHHVPAGE
jgi:sulfite exporter TauE/SafE